MCGKDIAMGEAQVSTQSSRQVWNDWRELEDIAMNSLQNGDVYPLVNQAA